MGYPAFVCLFQQTVRPGTLFPRAGLPSTAHLPLQPVVSERPRPRGLWKSSSGSSRARPRWCSSFRRGRFVFSFGVPISFVSTPKKTRHHLRVFRREKLIASRIFVPNSVMILASLWFTVPYSGEFIGSVVFRATSLMMVFLTIITVFVLGRALRPSLESSVILRPLFDAHVHLAVLHHLFPHP